MGTGNARGALRDAHASWRISCQQVRSLLWTGNDRVCALSAGGSISLSCSVARFTVPAVPRLDGLPGSRPRDRPTGIDAGQKPVPREPAGDAADLLAGDDAIGI